MTIEKLKALYNAIPFQPFVIHLADRREVQVHHRDFIAAAPSGRKIVVHQLDDSINIIDLLLVADVVPKPSDTDSGGRRKRRKP